MSWYDDARNAIYEVHKGLSESTPLTERTKAVDESYPFGMRKYTPYKMWLKARREYLCKYGYVPKGSPLQESPLERLMRRSQL